MKKKLLTLTMFAGVLILSTSINAQPTRYYVDTDVSISGTGLSWQQAFKDLQEALIVYEEGDEIWVAEGTYYPDRPQSLGYNLGDRTASFSIPNGVKLLGGFSGVEIYASDRDPDLFETILSGEIGDVTTSDNSFHVVVITGVNNTATIDGFTITAGYADETDPVFDNIIYVNKSANAPNYGDGESWETAFTFLQDAITAAQPGDQIWVAQGTYYPDEDKINFNGTDLRDAHFSLKDDVKIYGGFFGTEPGTEEGFNDRHWINYPTIISGEIGLVTNTDNSEHIFINTNVNENAVLDGFFIQDGYHHPEISTGIGAGMLNENCYMTIRNCTFQNNIAETYGGAIYSTDAHEKYVSCKFINNESYHTGGAVSIDAYSELPNVESPFFSFCDFESNTAAAHAGAVIVTGNYPVKFDNCNFTENNSYHPGGALFVKSSIVEMESCIFLNNSTDSGDGSAVYNREADNSSFWNCVFIKNNIDNTYGVGSTMSNYGNILEVNCFVTIINCTFADNNSECTISHFGEIDCTVANSILWNPINASTEYCGPSDEMSLNYCNVYGGYQYSGTGNRYVNPMFSDPTTSDYSLQSSSQCIDAANGPIAPEKDILGNGRIDYGNDGGTGFGPPWADMGAYEFVGKSHRSNISGNNGESVYETSGNSSGSRSENDKGGGIYIQNASPEIINCKIVNNYALNGGGIYVLPGLSSSVFTDCWFKGNYAANSGGAFYDYSISNITNSIFSENVSVVKGGAIYNEGLESSFNIMNVTNCTFYKNNSESGKAIACDNDVLGNPFNIKVINSILWDGGLEIWSPIGQEIDITYSDIENTYTGIGNINVNPLFVDEEAGSFHLKSKAGHWDPESPTGWTIDTQHSECIDKGDVSSDFELEPSPNGGRINMGAYGNTEEASKSFMSVIYVDKDATGGADNGTSWEDAYIHLQTALSVAISGDEIWVAEGTYYPDWDPVNNRYSRDRNASFKLINEVEIYGGFNATESLRTQRDWEINPTILTGDLSSSVYNSYHVFHHTIDLELNNTAILDGFIIEDGYANDEPGLNDRVGGGMYNMRASPSIINCTFRNNSALAGGAIFNNSYASPVIMNCIFHSNSATLGGAIGNTDNSSPYIEFCTVANNNAPSGGGMRSESSSSPVVKNCIFWYNNTGQIQDDATSTTTVTYTDVNAIPGTGNFAAVPDFVDVSQHDYHLSSTAGYWTTTGWAYSLIDSDCIDAADPTSEWQNEPMENGGVANVGAYGNTFKASKSNIEPPPICRYYVNIQAASGGDGESWNTAYNDLQLALNNATSGCEIWVAQGTYTPTVSLFSQDPDPRFVAFRLVAGVSMYGGFNGTENELSERNWDDYPTILSGNIGDPGISSDNSYWVLYGSDLTEDIIVDGFRCSDADGHLDGFNTYGGGAILLTGSTGGEINNCVFENNDPYGGLLDNVGNITFDNCIFQNNIQSIYNQAFGSLTAINTTANITNCDFFNNEGYFGGAINCIDNSVFNIEYCKFRGNDVTNNGGAIYSRQSTLMIDHCIIDNNHVYGTGNIGGGAIYNSSSDISIEFTTFYNNTADAGSNTIEQLEGAFGNATTTVKNSILWSAAIDLPQISGTGTINVSYSDVIQDVGDVYVGTENINEDPQFVDENNHDFHLLSKVNYWDIGINNWSGPNQTAECSPCIETGDPTTLPCIEPDGSDIVNMGAYGNTDQASWDCTTKSPLSDNEASYDTDHLLGVYPNPFSKELSVKLVVESDCFLKVTVYGVTGKKVATLSNGSHSAGTINLTWDGNDDHGNEMPNGVYIIMVETNDISQPVKVMLNK